MWRSKGEGGGGGGGEGEGEGGGRRGRGRGKGVVPLSWMWRPGPAAPACFDPPSFVSPSYSPAACFTSSYSSSSAYAKPPPFSPQPLEKPLSIHQLFCFIFFLGACRDQWPHQSLVRFRVGHTRRWSRRKGENNRERAKAS